ncbi:type II and III secretion system protein, partial [bacterium]|nr:type II and III secretion system protein [bacterium]
SLKSFISKMDESIKEINLDVLVVEYNKNIDKTFGLTLNDVPLDDTRKMLLSKDYSIVDTKTLWDFPYYLTTKLSDMFTIYLQVLLDESKIKICSNSSASVLNGRPVVIDVMNESLVSATGIRLKLVPYILENNEINIEIEPEVSIVSRKNNTSKVFKSNKKKSKTVLKVEDGHTIMIGGVLESAFEGGELPSFLKAFRSKSKDNPETELVFYITPSIVSKQGDTKGKTGGFEDIIYVKNESKKDKPLVKTKVGVDEIYRDVLDDNAEQRRSSEKSSFITSFKKMFGAYSEPDTDKDEMADLSQSVNRKGWKGILPVSLDSGYDVVVKTEQLVTPEYVNEPLPEKD